MMFLSQPKVCSISRCYVLLQPLATFDSSPDKAASTAASDALGNIIVGM